MASLLPLREAFADFTSIELTELGIWILEGSLEGGDAASLPAPGESALPAAAAPPRSYSPVAFPRLKVTASPFASASLRRSNGSPVPASPHSCASDGTPFAAAAAGLAPRQRQHFHCAAPQPAQQQQQQVSLRCFSPPPAACSASRPSQGGAAGSAALAWVAGWNCLAQAMGCAAPTPPASAWMQPHATTTSSRASTPTALHVTGGRVSKRRGSPSSSAHAPHSPCVSAQPRAAAQLGPAHARY